MKKSLAPLLLIPVFITALTLLPGCQNRELKYSKVITSSNIEDNNSKTGQSPNSSPFPSNAKDDAYKQYALNTGKALDKQFSQNIKLVPFVGVVEHIFIHPLLAYPEQAFNGDSQAKGFDDWFITVTEFTRVLNALYERNFILVDINSLYEEVQENGTAVMKKKEIMVPEGKRPIILSIDDLNYNRYMLGNGTNYKLVLTPEGNVAAYSKNPKGEDVVSYETEAVPILDNFVNAHSDFSLNGAKGVLALTGYEGILGYRTDRNSPDKDTEIQEAAKVVKRLKETGWTFASHSYGHPDITKITYSRLVDDSAKWKNEVESIIGPTQVYIYPFGAGPSPNDQKFKYLQSLGFKIFCHVGAESSEKLITGTNAVITWRRHLDGMSLRTQRKSFLGLYDANDIIDWGARPKR